MKNLRFLLLLASVILVLSACRSDAPAPIPRDPEHVTLRVVTSYGSEDGNRKNYEAALAEYKAITGNRVEDNSAISNEEWKARVLTDFETGSEPDVLFFFATADAEPLIHAGKVMSIQDIRNEYPEYASNMDPDKLPKASDGQCYAVPIMGYWEYLYVNKDVLSACGIPMPGPGYTWDQFLADCAVIRDQGYAPIACSLAEVAHYWFEFCVMNNGSSEDHLNVPTLNPDGTLLEDETARKWIAGLEDIKYLYEQGFFPANTLTAGDAETVAMFAEGKAAFLLDGSWKVGYFAENVPDQLDSFAVAYVPAKGQRLPTDTIGGISTGFFITRKAWEDPDTRDAAVGFVSLMTSDQVIETFVSTEITALVEDVAPDGLDSLQTSAAQVKAGTRTIVGAVQDMISGEARASLFSNIQNVVTGKMTAKEAVEIAMGFN